MLKVVGASWEQTKVITFALGIMLGLGVIVYIFGESEKVVEDGIYSATVYWTAASGFRIVFWGEGNNLDEISKGVARANYKEDIENNGWAFLEIQTEESSPDWQQAFAAGLLEGSLSWQLIYWHWYNVVEEKCSEQRQFCEQIHSFLEENMNWVKNTANQHKNKDPFWHQVHLYFMQLEGLEAGWKRGVERSREELELLTTDFLWLNAMNDLVELEQKFNGSLGYDNMGLSAVHNLSTAFLKLVPETKSLYVAHNSGGMYQSMLKVMKNYEFHYHITAADNSPKIPGQIISFSSYPGVLHSQDDFYSVFGSSVYSSNHQFAVVGTVINNYNSALWDFITPLDKVLLGPRVMSANRLATCGQSWGKILLRYNSGTGNKQWLVINYNHLAPNTALPYKRRSIRHRKKPIEERQKGLLWVIEQYPGFNSTSDQTNHLLKNSYWISLGGIPFHKDIAEIGNFREMQRKHGLMFSRIKSPTAQIMKRDQHMANNSSSIISLMRSNDYLNDPLSKTNPMLAVASRGDLAKDPKPVGSIDTKLLSGEPGKMNLHVISGPTPVMYDDCGNDSDDNVANDVANMRMQPRPFQWSLSLFHKLSHLGQPDIWHFPLVEVKWNWSQTFGETS